VVISCCSFEAIGDVKGCHDITIGIYEETSAGDAVFVPSKHAA
jgi:hypothetical protein